MTCTAREDGDAELFEQLAESVSRMAKRSPRSGAAFGTVIHKNGIKLLNSDWQFYLDMLETAGLIENIIHLNDGEVLMTVTARGLRNPQRGL